MTLKDKLEAAGYDTSGMDENVIVQKLDAAGYDTSSLQQPSQPKEASPMDSLKALTKQAVSITPMGAAGQVRDIVHEGADFAGEKAATGLASKGANPELAAGVGTAIKMIPDSVEAFAGSKAPAQVVKKAVQSTGEGVGSFLKAITPGAKGKIGKAIGEAERAAGIKQIIPTVSNTAKKLGLPARERGFADIVNSVKGKLDAGEKMDPQDLSDFRDLIKQQYESNKIARGSRADALTAQANDKAGKLLNELIPGRAKHAQDYAKISRIQNALKTLIKGTAIGGGAAGGIGLAAVALRKLAGH